jgi:hypothetical protein
LPGGYIVLFDNRLLVEILELLAVEGRPVVDPDLVILRNDLGLGAESERSFQIGWAKRPPVQPFFFGAI